MAQEKDILKTTPVPLANRPKHGLGPVYSASETRQHELFLEQLMLVRPDLSQREHCRQLKKKYKISTGRYNKLRNRIMDRWAREDDRMRSGWKSQAIRRIERWIRMAEDKKDLKLVQRFHNDLMEIQGVREPVRLDLHIEVQETLSQVIMELTPEQIDQVMHEYQDTQRLAAHARQLGMGTIDVAAE